MKAFIIYTQHKKSIEYSNQCLQSFNKYFGWEPELFEGITIETLPEYERILNISLKIPSRAYDFSKQDNQQRYLTKKSCSLNHYRLFKKCVELNTPISIIEHDSHCISEWKDYVFDDVLVMNIESAIKQPALSPIYHINKMSFLEGIKDINLKGLNYRHDQKWNGAHMMPGTAAYAITPQGAKKMIKIYENDGWEQSDFIINTHNVRIQTIVPELFTFNLPNLRMSHGENIL